MLQLNVVATSSVIPSWLLEVTKGYETDAAAQRILSSLATGERLGSFQLTDGVIRHKNRVWGSSNKGMQR